ncbi:WD40 repeat domain-containing protein [Actinospica robiniae]|uniref:WD40 repeat domain-containing protein n=1 Tax=Actinospica robiniae TaxID=304901 RepID=UPI00054E83BE|nr:hypothetical protein [Actinospica robiniae]
MTGTETVDVDTAGGHAIAWLRDRRSSRLLLLTGPEQSAPTLLAAVLVTAAAELPADARIHAQASARGLTPRVLAWVLAAQLGRCVAEPGDLARQLAADRRPVTLLIAELDAAVPGHDGFGRDALLDEVLRPLLSLEHVRLILATGNVADVAPEDVPATILAVEPEPDPDPNASAAEQSQPERRRALDGVASDPRMLLTAPPVDLAVAAELAWPDLAPASRMQWTSFGQAVTVASLTQPERAALWHAAAVATGDDALATALSPYLTGATFTARWARWRPTEAPAELDAGSGWIGPVLALAAPRRSDDGQVLAADALGRMHALDSATGSENGVHEAPSQSSGALVCMDTGALLAVSPDGAVILHEQTAAAEDEGRIADILAPDRSPAAHIRTAVTAPREQITTSATSLAATSDGNTLVVGDAAGGIHVFDLASRRFTSQLLQRHVGPVTTVSAIRMADTGDLAIISGARDGRLELSTFGAGPGGGTVAQRGTPVTAVSASESAYGPVVASAWADGMILLHSLTTRRQLAAIPLGWAPTCVLVTGDGAIIVGGPMGLLCLDLPRLPA